MRKAPSRLDVAVGQRVRARRLMRNMSQGKLAERLGLTFQQLQKYEKGTNRIGAGRLQEIAGILEAPISFFFGAAEDGDGARDVVQLLTSARALRLLQAYSRLDTKLQGTLVDLVERIADMPNKVPDAYKQ